MTKYNPYGSSIKDFDNFEKIGHGGFAEVFKARSLLIISNTFSTVAIKRISKKKNCEERIRSEIEINKSLPRIDYYVELYGTFQDKKYWYLVLELCTGGSLEQYVKHKGHLPENEALHLIKQVIVGVNLLHENNIIHRDLSWRNLLLTEDHKVKIADFGLAVKLNHPNLKTNTVLGTPSFMAPEVLSHDYYDFKADCWSVGCVLYALLFGDPPFKDQPAGHYRLNFPEKTKISREVEDLLRDMLNTNPKERIHLRRVHHILSGKQKTSSSSKLQHSTNRSGVSHQMSSKIQTLPSQYVPYSIKSHTRSPQDTAHLQNSDKDLNSRTSSSGYASEKCYKAENNSGTPSYMSSSFTKRSTEGNTTNYSSCKYDRGCSLNSSQNHLKPLNTEGLSSLRKDIEKKKMVVSILSDGQVCLECFKLRRKKNVMKEKKYVFRVYFISSDGSKISVHELEKGKEVRLHSKKPPSLSGKTSIVSHYTIEKLPNEHWKNYELAKGIVDKVKSITPKLTYRSKYGKFIMMANSPDPNFEMNFYNGFQITYGDHEMVIKNNMKCIVNQIDNKLLQEFIKLKHICTITEKWLEDYHDSDFPIPLRRKVIKKADKENVTPYLVTSSLNGTGTEMEPRTVTIEREGNPDYKSFQRNTCSPEYLIKVEDDYIIAEYKDGILMCISMQDDKKVFFQDVRTQAYLSKDKYPHLMKRYENDSRAVILHALQKRLHKENTKLQRKH